MPSDYQAICTENIEAYGTATHHLELFSGLYADRSHFILELLQNAEDAGATQIVFRLFETQLEVVHDGRVFNESDVRGLCHFAKGTKKNDLTAIGTFGIGFKSVHAYTKTPEIYARDVRDARDTGVYESFRIRDFVRPEAIDNPKELEKNQTTRFILPFNRKDVLPSTACAEISERLRRLGARTLLFLRNVQGISYEICCPTPEGDSRQRSGSYLRQEKPLAAAPGARQVAVFGEILDGGGNATVETEEHWLFFERPVGVSDAGFAGDDTPESRKSGTGALRVEVAFRLKHVEKSETKNFEVTRSKEAPLIAYFPTAKETHLGFLIQGPYQTTPARDNIPQGSDWNAWLIQETAQLVKELLPRVRELGWLSVSFLEALPLDPYRFYGNSMFRHIFEAVRQALRREALLPTSDGSFVAASHAKLVRGAELTNVLDGPRLCQFFKREADLKWLSTDITRDNAPALRTYLIEELGVEELDAASFVRKIDVSFLARQPETWFIRFYTYLQSHEHLWDHFKNPFHTGKPIFRLEDGRLSMPFEADGKTPKVFLPPLEGACTTSFSVVKQTIAADKDARLFLTRFGLAEPNLCDEVLKLVLPKYDSPAGPAVRAVSDTTEHYEDIQKIVLALGTDSQHDKKRLEEALRQTPFLRVTTLGGVLRFMRPGEVYRNTPDLRLYFADSPDVGFLHPVYAEMEPGLDEQLSTRLGLDELPRKILTSEGFPPNQREDSAGKETVENYDLEGLEAFLDRLETAGDFETQHKSALLLWRFLLEYLKRDARLFKGTYTWFRSRYRESQKSFDSLILCRLQEAAWIPTKERALESPENVTRDQLLDDFVGDTELLDGLQIGDSPGLDTEAPYRHAIAWWGLSKKQAEAYAQDQDEYMLAAMRDYRPKPEFPSGEVPNPERRAAKLIEQIADSPDKTYEKRFLNVRDSVPLEDAYVLLKALYTNADGQMVCQLCHDEMPFKKRDGSPYFEKREVLSRAYIAREHAAQCLALCPVCSAKYKEFVTMSLDRTDSMDALHEALLVLSRKSELCVPVSLGRETATLRFVEKHLRDLQVLLREEQQGATR